MSNMWSNCFPFVLITSRQPAFQSCQKIISASSRPLLVMYKQTNLKIDCYLTSGSFFHLSIIILAKMSFHRQIEKVIVQISNKLGVSLSVIQIMCAICWRLPHVYVNTIFTLHRNRYSYLKVLRYANLHSIFD